MECGAAIIADADEGKIKLAFKQLYFKTDLTFPKLYGDGRAAEFICGEMIKHL